MKSHKYAELFPLMEDDQLQELADDIKANGLRDKIITFEDKVLDGRNRERACRMAGVDAQYKEYTGTTPLEYVISRNLKRRHLSVKVRAEIAAKIATLQPSKHAASNEAAVSQTAAAAKVGVSRSSLQRAKRRIAPSKKKPKKDVSEGWSIEELKKDTELFDCFSAISAVYGNSDAKAIRMGSIGLKRSEVLVLAKLPKERMIEIQDLVMGHRYTPQEAIKFINDEPDEDSTLTEMAHWCLGTKGKFFTTIVGGFTHTVKLNTAAKR